MQTDRARGDWMSVRSTVDFNKVITKVRAAIGLYADTSGKKLEGYAKSNRVWTDRTSNARNSIQGSSGWQGDTMVVTVSGGVDYFPYLELAMGKQYAILSPTMQQYSNEILSGYKKVIS